MAVGDIDNDGFEDLLFSSNQNGCRLYRNLGNFKFEDITATAGIEYPESWTTGICMVDINGDGWLDIHVCRSGLATDVNRENLLFINNSDGTFSESAATLGLNDAGTSNQIYFLDFDLDGDLDAYVLNHPVDFENAYNPYFKPPTSKDSIYSNRFYINDGARFYEANDLLGMGIEKGFSLSVSIGDVNQDGWPDIYVANDFISPDYLLINQAGKGFRDQVSEYMSKTTLFSMGSDIADVNNDGLLDLFVADMEPGDHFRRKNNDIRLDKTYYDQVKFNFKNPQYSRNMLFLGTDFSFKEIGQMAGVAMTDWSWTTLFEDLDNDGLKDLFVTNGTKRDFHDMDYVGLSYDGGQIDAPKRHDSLDLIQKMPISLIPNHVFKNMNGLQFKDQTSHWGLDTALNGQGAAIADLNNDGLLDIVVNNTDAIASVLRNVSSNSSNYLRVKLECPASNRTAIGSQLRVWKDGKSQLKTNYINRGFQSSSSSIIHFGLPFSSVDSLVINWPNGDRQLIENPSVNQTLSVNYNPQSAKLLTQPSVPFIIQEQLDSILHKENAFDEIQRDKVVPFGLSKPGPVLVTGDLNGDGLDDLVVGCSRDEVLQVHFQDDEGGLELSKNAFEETRSRETAALLILDIDNDGDSDIYVGNGGNEELGLTTSLEDQLYLNDGKGNFSHSESQPATRIDSRALTTVDINQDGWNDVLVGGGFIPGSYGLSSGSRILINSEGKLEDKTEKYAPDFLNLGATHALVSVDIEEDGSIELITAGPWEPIRVWRMRGNRYISDKKPIAPEGLWNCLAIGDLNNDGFQDLVAGNYGLNTIFTASKKEPLELFVSDLDDNGSQDQVVTHYLKGEQGTFVDKGEFCEKMPEFNNKFLTNKQFAESTITEIVDGNNMDKLIHRTAVELKSMAFIHNGKGAFAVKDLPLLAQEAPVKTIQILNVTNEPEVEILLFGNSNSEFYDQGDILASRGCIVSAAENNFRALSSSSAGLNVYGVVNSSVTLRGKEGVSLLLGRNSDSVIRLRPNE